MKYLKVIDNNHTKKYLPILRIIIFNSLIDIIHYDDYINSGCNFSSFRYDNHDVAQFIAEKIINSDQKIWTKDQIQEMIAIGIKYQKGEINIIKALILNSDNELEITDVNANDTINIISVIKNTKTKFQAQKLRDMDMIVRHLHVISQEPNNYTYRLMENFFIKYLKKEIEDLKESHSKF